MTEKQFKVVDNYLVSYDGDYFDLHKPSNIRSLVTVANYVVDENEQLKSIIDKLTLDNTKMKKVLNTTKKENEQIKHLIKEVYHNERTELGKSVLKQLLETIQ